MIHREFCDAVRHEGHALGRALDAVDDGDTPVPDCPEWNAGTLAHHVGQVLGFWCEPLSAALDVTCPELDPVPDALDDRRAWLSSRLDAVCRLLDQTDAETATWTWLPEHQTAGFVARRLAHELAVHRVDAQRVTDRATPIEATLAVDGIDEIFFLLSGRDDPGPGSGTSLHIHATDVEGEWLVRFDPTGIVIEPIHAKGDLAVRGSASDLELLLYRRAPIGDVDRFGSDAVLDTWYDAFRL